MVGLFGCRIILLMTSYTICWRIRKRCIVTRSTFILNRPMCPFQNIILVMNIKCRRLPARICAVTRGTIYRDGKLNVIRTLRPFIIQLVTVHTSIRCSLVNFIGMTRNTTFANLLVRSSQWIKLMPISGFIPFILPVTF